MLTPLDIDNKQFTKSFKGYNAIEVDDFLDEISKDYDSIMRECLTLKETIKNLEAKNEQYEYLENALQEVLVVAKETTDNMKTLARKEAEQIIQKANMQVVDRLNDINEEITKKNIELDKIKKETQIYKAKVESVLTSAMEMLKELEDNSEEKTEAKVEEQEENKK